MRILSSKVVEDILNGITVEDIKYLQKALENALMEYKEDASIVPSRIVTNKEEATHLFMPSIGSNVGIKTITGSKYGFKGATLIIDPIDGNPLCLLDAGVTTAFRTALCSTLPLVKALPPDSKNPLLVPSKVFVYGVGLQAYWHIKLTISLYPSVDEVFICNRTLAKAVKLCIKLGNECPRVKFTPLNLDNKDDIEKSYKNVSIVYGCLPASSPTILKRYVDEQKTSGKKLYVSVIGSYKPHMTEVDGQIIEQIVASGGKIVVDSIEHACSEAGELIQNNVSRESLIEVCDFISCKCNEKSSSTGDFVLCKLVGLSIMDICIGAELLRLAQNMNKGVTVDF